MDGTWRAFTGSPAVAARVASARPGLLRDYMGWALPGEIRDAGGGWVEFGEVTYLSLRIYAISDEDDGTEVLHGPGEARWPLVRAQVASQAGFSR